MKEELEMMGRSETDKQTHVHMHALITLQYQPSLISYQAFVITKVKCANFLLFI